MRPIPPTMRDEMAKDDFYKKCVIGSWTCDGPVEWHHVFIYAGRQINEKWAILPACHLHHGMVKTSKTIREEFESISLQLATPEDLAKYPKKDWRQIIKYLKTL